jgi:uncharacterized protein (TIGR00255 family)
MTGHGQATIERDQIRVVVEARSVNNRFLKTSVTSDLGATIDGQVESIVKQRVHRGSVNLRIKTTFLDASNRYRLNEVAIRQYWLQLTEIAQSSQSVNVESVLQLPGVIDETGTTELDDGSWTVIQQAVESAVDRMIEMRAFEGQAMKSDMLANVETIATELDGVRQLAPQVVAQYSDRLTERINKLLSTYDVSITPADVVKEVGVFADRCDVSEETVRLTTHLDQFRAVIEQPRPGKKLDFLVQEMLRETNTIGSKANDADIARHVVEIKTSIERIREMVQNIE